jgi:hypothetical protein
MKLNTKEHMISFHDESGKQICLPFKSGWGCPMGGNVSFGPDKFYVIIQRTERVDGSLELIIRKNDK